MDELIFILGVFSFGLGACIASFLNVVIWRVPRGESIVSPPSHCPKCNALIRWYQNIPILAWLALRGKCANCKEPISPRYILIETLGGLLFLAAFLAFLAPAVTLTRTGISAPWPCVAYLVVMWIWISLMIVGSMIDYDLQLLPDFVTVGGMVLGLVFSGAMSACRFFALSNVHWFELEIVWSLAGLVLGFGLLWLIRFIGGKVFKREAMGLGDVFLMGAVGALFGPVAVLVTLVLSSLFGSVIGLGMIALAKARFGRFTAIPYGPYICLGCLAWMFYGQQIVSWYLTLLGMKG